MKTTKSDLTAARLRELLHYDPETGVFTRKVQTTNSVKVGDVAGGLDNKGYLKIRVDVRLYWAHRLAWLYVHGVWPEDQIDHINRIRDDNRISNLRQATCAENNQNTRIDRKNTSGYKGVSWKSSKGKWVAQITINNKNKEIGCYRDINDAIAARKAAEAKYHPFAVKEVAHV